MSPGRSRRSAARATAGGSKLRRNVSPGETERVAVWMTTSLATKLRVYAAEQRMAISVVVEEAVRNYLG